MRRKLSTTIGEYEPIVLQESIVHLPVTDDGQPDRNDMKNLFGACFRAAYWLLRSKRFFDKSVW